jgi:acetolactate synthase-1/2/3 large subunit
MLRAAIRVATGPAPGPVHLEIPADMFRADAGKDPVYREENLGVVNARRIPPEPGVMRRVVERLLKAERPLLIAGKGVIISEAWDEFARLARILNIPAVTTLGGKGAIDEDDDLAVGVMGRSSRIVANKAVNDCDLVLAVGTRFGGLPTSNWALPFEQKTILQIDSDPTVLGQNYRTEISVLADAKRALQAALDEVEGSKLQRGPTAWTTHIKGRIKQWRIDAAKLAQERPGDGIHPAEIIAQMRQVMGPDDIVGADTGALGSWIGGLFPVRAGKSVVRADGSLGWSVPGAMGAKLAAPHRRVVALTGDGGLLYHISEFETALRYDIPVVIVVLNNRALASEYHSQRDRWQRVIPEVIDFRDVDFASVARSFGAYGVRVEQGSQFTDALRGALAANKPALIDVVTSKETAAPRAHYDAERVV